MDLGWHVERIHHALYVAVREQVDGGGEADHRNHYSQSVKGAQKGALLDPQGFDAGKKITGRKGHILVDLGLLLSVASIPPIFRIAMEWHWC